MKECEICGSKYKPVIISQKYCSNYCREISKIPKWKRPTIYTRTCRNCGEIFKTKYTTKIYCSSKCKSKYLSVRKVKPKVIETGSMKYVDKYIPTNTGYDREIKTGEFKVINLSKSILDILDTLYYKHIGNDFNYNYLKRITDSCMSRYEIVYYAKFKNIILYERIDDD